MKKTLGVVITDGVGYRNFVKSQFIQEATVQFDAVIVFSCLPATAYQDKRLKVVEIPVFEENFITWFFRKAKELAHSHQHARNNFGFQDNLRINYPKSNTARGFATRFLWHFTRFFCSEKSIAFYEKCQYRSFKNHPKTILYQSLLQKYHLQHLFFTHQRPPYIAPLIAVAQKNKIPTSTFIFSWDNLASKGRMSGTFDYYLVWSSLMKAELLQYYPRLQNNQIAVVGTPQFEPYIMPEYQLSEADFFLKFDLKKNQPILLFSCGDVSTSPNDTVYIAQIANAIQQNKLVQKVQVLVRTSPAESPERFRDIAQQFPFIKWNYPKWEQTRNKHQESWSQRIPTTEDLADLKAVLAYSDMCINMLSTMSLDALFFQKPVINVVMGHSKNEWANDQRFLNYVHIQKMVATKATKIALDEDSLLKHINFYLENPLADAENRQQLMDMQIGAPLQGTSQRIAKTLKEWS